jgi:anti-sigma regulatory factor (Ser/Thr protein kinase)
VPHPDQFDQENPLLEPISTDGSPVVDSAILVPLPVDAEVKDPCRKEFDFSGVLDSVPENREQVMEFVAQHCPDEETQIDLLVAVQEALANAALHGCHDDPAKRIRCIVTVDDGEITIAVRDPGPGFDLKLADPEDYRVTKLSHGRGICLIRSLVTEVTFAHHGAEIIMRKRL